MSTSPHCSPSYLTTKAAILSFHRDVFLRPPCTDRAFKRVKRMSMVDHRSVQTILKDLEQLKKRNKELEKELSELRSTVKNENKLKDEDTTTSSSLENIE